MIILAVSLYGLLVVGIINNFWVYIGYFILIIALLMLPIAGFKAPKCTKIIKLEQLKRDGKKAYVEKKNGKVIYAIDIRKMFEADVMCYEEMYFTNRVKIYESPECEEPILKIVKIFPADRPWLTFAPFSTKLLRVFVVPTGSVLEETKK